MGREPPGSGAERTLRIFLPSPRASQPSLPAFPFLPTPRALAPPAAARTPKSPQEERSGPLGTWTSPPPAAWGWSCTGMARRAAGERRFEGLGVTHRCPARAAAPSLAPWAGGRGWGRGGTEGLGVVLERLPCGLLAPSGGPGPGLAPPAPERAPA